MIDKILADLDLQALFLIVVVLIAVRAFSRMLSAGNPVEGWHFYASRGADGNQYGDPNKLGIMVGIVASTLFVGYTFWAHAVDNWYVVAIFALWLVFIAGTEYFAKWFRSFLDRKVGTLPAPQQEEKKP